MVDLERVVTLVSAPSAAVDPSRYVQTRPDQIANRAKATRLVHARIAYLIAKPRDCDARM